MALKLTFLGAAETVTGSKYLLETEKSRVLVDCGLFQGLKRLRERNWERLPFDAPSLHAVLLTHAHLDHSGCLPLLFRSGYRGPVYCTAATRQLLGILLPDSARLQEEEAQFANRHRFSKHSPALPLYTESDAFESLKLLRTVHWSTSFEAAPGVSATYSPAGHLLGAASVRVETASGRVLFSGDLGRSDDPLMRAPDSPPDADWLVIESTYGDRKHMAVDAEAELGAALARALARGGTVVVPSFATGRAQLLLHLIARLKVRHAIPDVPVFLNSPMATDVRELYRTFRSEHRLSAEECDAMCAAAQAVRTVEESKELNASSRPAILIAGSGMAVGGRVVHHLKAFAPGERNLILLTGYQAAGTRGAALLNGAEVVKIHGEWIPVRAEVVQLRSTSSHADYPQLVAWARRMSPAAKRIFVTHGEPAAADALRQYLRREITTEVTVPAQGESYKLDRA